MALAPSLALLGVPSRAISVWSTMRWSVASRPSSSSAISLLTLSTAWQHRLAAVLVAAVAQLDCLVLAGRSARGHRGAPGGARLELDLDLDRGVAARVEDLPADDVDDDGHGAVLLVIAVETAFARLGAAVVVVLCGEVERRPLPALARGQLGRAVDPAHEPVAGLAQGDLGIDARLAGHVDGGEQQVAELVAQPLLEIGEAGRDPRPDTEQRAFEQRGQLAVLLGDLGERLEGACPSRTRPRRRAAVPCAPAAAPAACWARCGTRPRGPRRRA